MQISMGNQVQSQASKSMELETSALPSASAAVLYASRTLRRTLPLSTVSVFGGGAGGARCSARGSFRWMASHLQGGQGP